jgi:hypothetical protein
MCKLDETGLCQVFEAGRGCHLHSSKNESIKVSQIKIA